MLASRMRAVAIRTRSLAPTVSSLFHTSSPSSSSSLYTNTGNSYSNALFTQRQHTYQQQQRYFSTEEGDEGEAEVEEELYYELKKSSKGNLPFHTHFTDEGAITWTMVSKFSGDTDLLVADLQRAVGPWYEIIPKGEKKLLIKGKHTKALKAYFAEEDQLVGGRIV